MSIDSLVAVGISPTASALTIRERIASLAGRDTDLLIGVRRLGIDDAVLLSTDERLEYIGYGPSEAFCWAVQSTLAEMMDVPEADLSDQIFLLTGLEALRHLFMVAAGLDDLIPGGSQAWEGLKSGLVLSRQQGMASDALIEVTKAAVGVAERVRTVTELSSKPVSMAAAATRIAKDIFGDLSAHVLLIWGNHERGVLIANQLHQSGFKDFIGLGITEESQAVIKPIRYSQSTGDIQFYLIKADVVVCAAAEPPFSVTQDMMRRVLKQRKNKPVFLIDTTIPGVVDPMVANLDGAFLYDLNDLEQVVMEGRNTMSDDIAEAWSIIEQELQPYTGDDVLRSVNPLPRDIQRHITDCFPDEGPGFFSDELRAFLTHHLNALPDKSMRSDFKNRLRKMMKLVFKDKDTDGP